MTLLINMNTAADMTCKQQQQRINKQISHSLVTPTPSYQLTSLNDPDIIQ